MYAEKFPEIDQVVMVQVRGLLLALPLPGDGVHYPGLHLLHLVLCASVGLSHKPTAVATRRRKSGEDGLAHRGC